MGRRLGDTGRGVRVTFPGIRGKDAAVFRATLRAMVLAGLAATLASCSNYAPRVHATNEYFSPAVFGAASPRVVADDRMVPKGGGTYTVGKPYRVAGKTYVPQDNPRYSAVGLASWYGSAFHGRMTANGEVYDVNELTAAHPTLPLPSYARVTNLENGRSVVVRINDRGPFARNRVIDVSRAAADMLAFRDEGTARVEVDYVGPARMDGLDHDMLVASYRGPGSQPGRGWGNAQLASAPALRSGVMLASAAPASAAPRIRPADLAAQPMILTPAYAPVPTYAGDNLGALILKSGFTQSYAEQPVRTGAQTAAAELSAHDLTTALTQAAARKARELAAAKAAGLGQ
jgi:rare lipoprotein A